MQPEALAAALRDFADRIARCDPGPSDGVPPEVPVEVRVGAADPVRLTGSAAEALVAALRAYHDPRDRGRCDQCGGRRLDEALQCLDCGQPGGLFGQLVRERLQRHHG
ncbi:MULTISPECIES: hypothetical protein [unclassified Solwaraspora]|uniref:hypothetical protein n=1 Tax=unclassified Solwaraspora TaxID=2627926 RepID=UPI00259AEDD8|nr:hypothetical protein [Solwaraspora sp. WMMA2056]WJK38348.1 hypothetical protein O7608_17730 [Solwaraspora sp. WMMA2056]